MRLCLISKIYRVYGGHSLHSIGLHYPERSHDQKYSCTHSLPPSSTHSLHPSPTYSLLPSPTPSFCHSSTSPPTPSYHKLTTRVTQCLHHSLAHPLSPSLHPFLTPSFTQPNTHPPARPLAAGREEAGVGWDYITQLNENVRDSRTVNSVLFFFMPSH